MEYIMYLCPTCNKTYKVKGSGKKVKCKTCGQMLEDMEIDDESWAGFDKAAKEKYISDMFEFVDEDNEAETTSDAGLMNSLFDMMDDQKASENESAVEKTQVNSSVTKKKAGSNTAVAGNTTAGAGKVVKNVTGSAQKIVDSDSTVNNSAKSGNSTTQTSSDAVDTKALAAEVALLMKRYHMKVDMFMVIISFLLPFIGWMIYACNAGDSPKQAKKVMIISLVGTALYVIGYVVYYSITYGF